MKSHSWKYLDPKTLVQIIALIILQQAMNAFGTYALVKAGFSIQVFHNFLLWISLALAIHVISPLMSVIIRPLETKTTFKSYQKFLKERLLGKSLNPALWAQKSRREIFLASIGSETDSYLAAIIFVGLDIFSYILSLVLGVWVIGTVLDIAFVPAFMASAVLSFLAYRSFQKKVTMASHAEQEGRTKLASFLLLSWENIFFKNKSIVQNYQKQFVDNFEQTEEQSVFATRWSEGFVAILSTVSAMPVIIALVFIASKNNQSPALLTALLVTIPRQLNLLTTFRSAFQASTSFISFEAKFQTLLKNSELPSEPIENRILISEISLQGQVLETLVQTVSTIEEKSSGRFVVRGKNGAGKSTLLLHLNEKLLNSFYLPAHPQFLLEGSSVDESTGQRLIRHILHVAETDATHLLLDEWDANLDDHNIQQINLILEDLSQKKVIVEVRHRA